MIINDAEDRMLKAEIARRGRMWDAKFDQMQAEIQRKDQLIEEARNRRDLQAYIQRRVSEERDEIAPQLIDFIRGNTVEEVDRAIIAAKQKTNSIVQGIREAFEAPGAPAQAGIPSPGAQQPQPQPQQPSDQDVEGVEVGSPEHMALRAAFGIDRSRGRGILG